jgi:DNA-binding CsgD family transcriptional regulator/tetratricopeptide (TPR) repeat protein
VAELEAEARRAAGYSLEEGLPPLGWYQFLRGDWAGARANLLGYLERHVDEPSPGLRGFALELLEAQGDWAGARAMLATMSPRDPAEEPGLDSTWLAVHCAWSRVLLAEGDVAGARAWLTAADHWAAQRAQMPFRSALRMAWARVHHAAGDTAAAWAEAQAALAQARRGGEFRQTLGAHLLLGELALSRGDTAAAQEHLTTALDIAERCRFPYYAAQARLGLGRLWAGGPAEPAAAPDLAAAPVAPEPAVASAELAAVEPEPGAALAARVPAPDPAAALQELTAARDTFARLGARPGLARAEAAIAGLTAATQPGPGTDLEPGSATRGQHAAPDGQLLPPPAPRDIAAPPQGVALTRREREIVYLVAQGLTDKEIAGRLFISPRTVDGHLRNIFNKVGVNNRAALAAFAARHGLAP